MSRTESSSTMSQGYLDFHCMCSAIPLLGSGLGPKCKMGRGHKFFNPTLHIKIINLYNKIIYFKT